VTRSDAAYYNTDCIALETNRSDRKHVGLLSSRKMSLLFFIFDRSPDRPSAASDWTQGKVVAVRKRNKLARRVGSFLYFFPFFHCVFFYFTC
jgi:hypothetical protein